MSRRLTNSKSTDRLPHAILDADSRFKKAVKIERLLKLHECRQPITLLDIGAGSGFMAHYFGTHPTILCEVTAVDRINQCQTQEGFRFVEVTNTSLPFQDLSFDVVISNHVIEHVGSYALQIHHLHEIRRVLKNDGMAYLATPNRFMIIEPHFQLAFLSWLPKSFRTPYLRMRKRGKAYDCEPLTKRKLIFMLKKSDFLYNDLTIPAFYEWIILEKKDWVNRTVSRFPPHVLQRMSMISPTLIYCLRRP